MTKVKTEEELNILRRLALIHKQVFSEVRKLAVPGVNAKQIDELADFICKSHNVLPAFKGLYGFEGSICVSINDVVAHGTPTKEMVFKSGDVVSFDFGVKDKESGLNTDAAFTMIVGESKILEHQDLIRINQEALMKGIAKAKPGMRVGDIGNAIEKHISENSDFHLIKKLSGHGIGTNVHEEPYVYNYGKAGTGEMLKENQTYCIEPLIGITTGEITKDDAGNIVMADGGIGTHFEHMIIIKNGYPEILV